MAARKNTRNQSEGKSLPWGPMLLSFAVGAFVMFLLHLKDNVPADKAGDKKPAQQQTKKATTVEPKFDFYTLLPEMEVMVEDKGKTKQPIVTSPNEAEATQNDEPNDSHSNQQVDTSSYLIQVGSFKRMTDADAFRARLALLGIESKVQTVTIDSKETWHRVQIGPVTGRDKADALQKQLRDNGFNPLLMRAKHS